MLVALFAAVSTAHEMVAGSLGLIAYFQVAVTAAFRHIRPGTPPGVMSDGELGLCRYPRSQQSRHCVVVCFIVLSLWSGLDEINDMQGTRREMRPKTVGQFLGRNGQGHDEARIGEASGCSQSNGKDAQGGSEEVGRGNEAQMGGCGRNLGCLIQTVRLPQCQLV